MYCMCCTHESSPNDYKNLSWGPAAVAQMFCIAAGALFGINKHHSEAEDVRAEITTAVKTICRE